MTTVGVEVRNEQKVLPCYLPAHQLARPAQHPTRLAAVKHDLFHPRLPSFRQMDRDTSMHRLPDEHCRTATSVGPRDFARSTLSEFQPPRQNLHVMDSTPFGRQQQEKLTGPDLAKSRAEWTDFFDHSPARFDQFKSKSGTGKDFHFTGYKVRYMKPQISGSWNYVLRQEPVLDQYGPKPLPANIYARYRDTTPQYARSIATEAWRPF